MINRLKQQIKLIESILTEGMHWPKDYRQKAINRITDALKYSNADIERDVDKMVDKFEPLSHENSNLGYFLPIIRMFIDYVGNDQAKRKEFLGSENSENSENSKIDMLIKNLGIISQDPSLELKFKDDIKQKWSLDDFEKHAAEIQAEIDKNDADQLASVGDSTASDYEIIIINSYKELHDKFGGDKTGYNGRSEWCHTNGKSTYDSWTSGGIYQFFVLAKKGWENIQPPDPKTTNAFDEYGTSLIAILVKVENSELLNATLRWNHIIEPGKTVPKTSVDKAFLGWGDLSKAVGFNVKAVVEKDIKHLRDKFIAKTKKIMTTVTNKLKNITEITQSTFTVTEKRFIKHLDIPNNITSIGDEAFYECINLISITIPDSVTRIGNTAFCVCTSLNSITIPNSVTSIDYSAFASCRALTSITIPDSVKSLERQVFAGCRALTSITIPDSVTSIGGSAFASCRALTSITIPDSVTSIGNDAFLMCSSLTDIKIPDRVTSIGNRAFNGCSGLTSVTIPDSVTSIGDNAFSGCSSLTSVTIPDNVTYIGSYAFSSCSGLTSITIPDSVTSIGSYAFSSCSGLTSATFKGKTMDEVKAMTYYPWQINDPENVITVEAGND